MWCKHCHQDVPAVAIRKKPDTCGRCGNAFETREAERANHPPIERQLTPPERLLDADTDRRVRDLGRSIRRPLLGAPAMRPGEVMWLDIPKADRGGAGGQLRDPRALRDDEYTPARVQWGAWLATTLGLGLAAAGAVLLSMALWGNLPEYWTWGVGTALTGQALLAAGLIWMLACLWKTTRTAANRLASCEQQLAAVNRSAEMILGQRVAGASAFYGELARGASPTTLMSSLQGQVAQLATRLHHDI
jgi:hypothetical protein